MEKKDIILRAMKQLALDNGCQPEDFLKRENVVVEYKALEGRRLFRKEGYFFKMTTFGHNVVVSAHENILPWCREYFAGKEGIRCFEYSILKEIDEKLIQYGYTTTGTDESYLFHPGRKSRTLPEHLEVKWFEGEEITPFYGDKRFPNAILRERDPARPDMLVVCSFDSGEITGMAGCSADSADVWQIGIDVLPAHRQRGLATALVNLMTDEILRRGNLPHYATWCANIASRSIALNCGYFPAWVDAYSQKAKNEL